MCQIRLDFDTFVTESPNTESNSPLSVIPTGNQRYLSRRGTSGLASRILRK